MDNLEEIEKIFMDKIKPYEQKIKLLEQSEQVKQEQIKELKLKVIKLNKIVDELSKTKKR